MKPKDIKLQLKLNTKKFDKAVREVKKNLPRVRPIKVSLSKHTFDNTGKKTDGVILISCFEMNFHQLLLLLRGFPFVGLDRYPLYSSDPANSFRLVKAITGATRMNTILCTFELSFHGDPKYWKWALIASGLVKK